LGLAGLQMVQQNLELILVDVPSLAALAALAALVLSMLPSLTNMTMLREMPPRTRTTVAGCRRIL
jgi:hypothetical protein